MRFHTASAVLSQVATTQAKRARHRGLFLLFRHTINRHRVGGCTPLFATLVESAKTQYVPYLMQRNCPPIDSTAPILDSCGTPTVD